MNQETEKPTAEENISNPKDQLVSYSDFAKIGMTAEEFIIHFGLRSSEQAGDVDGVAKIYVSPTHAKRIYQSLGKIVENYELHFGEIKTNTEDRLTPEGKKLIEERINEDEKDE